MWSIPLYPTGTLWPSSAKLRESIEMSFVMVSAVDRGIGVLDGVHIAKGNERFLE